MSHIKKRKIINNSEILKNEGNSDFVNFFQFKINSC